MFGISSFSELPFAAAPPTAPENILSRLLATGAVGTVQNGGLTVALAGVSASGLLGTISVGNRSFALTGVPGVGLVSSPLAGQLISGTVANGAVGDVNRSISVALTSASAAGLTGNFGVFYWSLIVDDESANWQNITTE